MIRRISGFTLVEVLSVISILAMVLMGVMTRISAAHASAESAEMFSEIRHFDARARFLARTGGAVWWVQQTPTRWTLKRARTGEILREMELPFPTTLRSGRGTSFSAETALDAVLFDRSGRSRDYQVRLVLGERIAAMEIFGLTGVIRLSPTPERE